MTIDAQTYLMVVVPAVVLLWLGFVVWCVKKNDKEQKEESKEE